MLSAKTCGTDGRLVYSSIQFLLGCSGQGARSGLDLTPPAVSPDVPVLSVTQRSALDLFHIYSQVEDEAVATSPSTRVGVGPTLTSTSLMSTMTQIA